MTNLGKDICKHLKAIRRQIAQENDIALDIPECTYKGDCSGTCPRCESELQYLESELTRRSSFGKAALVAGVAFTMATAPAVVALERTDQPKAKEQQVRRGKCQLSGKVVDAGGKPVLFANVDLKQNGQIVVVVTTDQEGAFQIKNLKKGTYEMTVSCVGFMPADTTIEVRKNSFVQQTLLAQRLEGIVPVLMGKPAMPYTPDDSAKCDSAAGKGVTTIESDLWSEPSAIPLVGAVQVLPSGTPASEPVLPIGTPASEPAEPQPIDRPKNNDIDNPLDKEAR